jgi:hypothetical protein
MALMFRHFPFPKMEGLNRSSKVNNTQAGFLAAAECRYSQLFDLSFFLLLSLTFLKKLSELFCRKFRKDDDSSSCWMQTQSVVCSKLLFTSFSHFPEEAFRIILSEMQKRRRQQQLLNADTVSCLLQASFYFFLSLSWRSFQNYFVANAEKKAFLDFAMFFPTSEISEYSLFIFSNFIILEVLN